jgi:thiamine biosynthesis lipoprotein ApbE
MSKRIPLRSSKVVAFCLCSLLGAHDLQRVEVADEAMGTTFSIVAYGHDRAKLDAAVTAAFTEVHRLDRLISNYDAASEWSAVNRITNDACRRGLPRAVSIAR